MTEIIDAVRQENLPLEQALQVATSNVAAILKLHAKGRIAVDLDADLVLLDGDDQIAHMVMNGKSVVHDGERLVRGTFE